MRQISAGFETVSFCQELLRCDSQSGQESAVADLVERELNLLGYDHVERDETGSVVGVLRGQQRGLTILFDAHLDVVPAPHPEAWRYPPFAGTRAEGRLWGRGAADVKGSLAAALVALGTLSRPTLAGRLILSASVGEELAEGLALRAILARYSPDIVVICEPTATRLGIGHKGRAGIVLEAVGRAAHSSTPHLGVNAAYSMIEAIQRIRHLALHQDDLLGPGVNELVELISSPYPGGSVVPDGCRARFDRRLVRGETRVSVLAEMRSAVEDIGGVTLRYHRVPLTCYTGHVLEEDDFHAAWALPPDSAIVQRAAQGLEAIGQDATPWLAPYCTNGAASAGELGLPTLIYGAGDIAAAHSVDESIALDELHAAVRGYTALAHALTQG